MTQESASLERLTLSNKEFAALAGVGMSRWYQLQRANVFRGLESPIPGRWSRPKVEAWLRGDTALRLPRRKAS